MAKPINYLEFKEIYLQWKNLPIKTALNDLDEMNGIRKAYDFYRFLYYRLQTGAHRLISTKAGDNNKEIYNEVLTDFMKILTTEIETQENFLKKSKPAYDKAIKWRLIGFYELKTKIENLRK